MTLRDYQIRAGKTAIYPGAGTIMGLAYCALGLGETGEFQGKVKKILRDANGEITEEKKAELSKELGDVLWYVQQTATELGLNLNDVAMENVNKLESRQQRGVLQGSGDNR